MGASASVTGRASVISVQVFFIVTSCLFCLLEGRLFLSDSFAVDYVVGVHDELAAHPPCHHCLSN